MSGKQRRLCDHEAAAGCCTKYQRISNARRGRAKTSKYWLLALRSGSQPRGASRGLDARAAQRVAADAALRSCIVRVCTVGSGFSLSKGLGERILAIEGIRSGSLQSKGLHAAHYGSSSREATSDAVYGHSIKRTGG